jgi:hypothetical protein
MMNKGMRAGTLGTRGQGMGAGAKSGLKGMRAGTLGTRGQGMGAAAEKGMKKGGKVKAKGGSSYRKAADGVAHKGKTKARMVKMAMGGKC